MSALNVVIATDAAHVFSDAAGYDARTGKLLGFSQKVAMLAHLPAVLATRGSLAFLPTIAEECNSRFDTFDDLAAGIVEAAQAVTAALAPVIAKCGSSQLELVAAGWSRARNRPEAYLVQSGDWNLQPIEVALVTPADDDLKARLAGLGVDPMRPDHGLRLMREQKARKWTLGDAGISAVGGFCQIASVTRDGVSSRVLERWC